MIRYKPILPQDLSLSGDVIEEQRTGQRNDALPWFWRMGTANGDQGNPWMDECESWSQILLDYPW
jgi:hypothetical protein